MAAGKEIKRLRGRVSAQDAATLIGVDVERLRKWEQRDVDPKDTGDIQKIEKFFGVRLDQLNRLENFQFIPKKENLSLEEEQIQYGASSTEALLKLIENNTKLADGHKALSDANKDLAAANLILARNNEKLVAMLESRMKPGPEMAPPGTPGTETIVPTKKETPAHS